MDKLIITCCLNDPTFFQGVPGLHQPITVEEVADAAKAACDAGAAIVHVHEPMDPDRVGPMREGAKESAEYRMDAWREVSFLIRQSCHALIEHGQGGRPYLHTEHRIPPISRELLNEEFDFAPENPDLINVILGPQHTQGRGIYVTPTREELERWMQKCLRGKVKPAFEVWQAGAFYNLEYLAGKGLVDKPYWVGLFLGTQTSVGSPPTIEELMHRLSRMPKDCLWTVCPCCSPRGICNTQQQQFLLAQAITLGGHVRLGMEDNPYYWDGVPADSNAQLVERIVRVARDLGREIATPQEARWMLGLPER